MATHGTPIGSILLPAGYRRALPQLNLGVWDFWRGFARARTEFSLLGNRYFYLCIF
jgi:hypothetical protein